MTRYLFTLAALLVATTGMAADPYDVLRASMQDKNQATLARLVQDEVQAYCSKPRDASGDPDTIEAIRQARLAMVKMPADGVFLGDWRQGADIANNGRGLQSSDDPDAPNGGNCYACHQLDPRELAYGTLGPSLRHYGARGQDDAVLKYTWTKLWDTHAYNVCSHMPRFGAQGILTEQQLRHVMAYLLDPRSPVNLPIQE